MFTNLATVVLALSLNALAAVHQIQVSTPSGGNPLSFTPPTIKANVGDSVMFNFVNANQHSVASYQPGSAPCTPGPSPQGQLYSGLITGSASNPPQYVVNVKTSQPMYFYCSFPNHCARGMVGIINPANASAIQIYTQASLAGGKGVSPQGGVTGGTVTGGKANSANAGNGGNGGNASPASSSPKPAAAKAKNSDD